jgi:hypothetical protein
MSRAQVEALLGLPRSAADRELVYERGTHSLSVELSKDGRVGAMTHYT